MVGTRQRVLVDGPCRARTRASSPARTDNNRVVNFAGDAASIGTYVDVDITDALPHSLRGDACTAHASTRADAAAAPHSRRLIEHDRRIRRNASR